MQYWLIYSRPPSPFFHTDGMSWGIWKNWQHMRYELGDESQQAGENIYINYVFIEEA